MSEEAEIKRKMKKTSQMLFLQRPRAPGVKGWELKRAVGKDYVKIIEILNSELDRIDLEVKTVYEEGEEPKEPSPEQLDRARFFIIVKNLPSTADITTTGWRIDDISILASIIAYITSKHGKVPRKDVDRLLREKFPNWKVDMNIERYIRRGYIVQDKDEVLAVGWRTRAEIDQKTLMNLILSNANRPKET